MYVKFNPRWLPFPNTSTPITDKALDHIEQGITDVDVTRPGTPAEVELSSRLSGVSGSAEGLVQAERAAREAAVTAEATARADAIEAETAARKTAIIGESDARIAALALKANADAVYTKAQVDAAVSPKANSVDVYTKAQSDTALALKADKTDVYSRAETGTQITNAITASRPPLYGTGFPNGVVAAPVGTLYSDTAVTNGASLWQKISGTGTTGWVVALGDTGIRNCADLLSPDLVDLSKPAALTVRRVGRDVTLEFSGFPVAGGGQVAHQINGLRLSDALCVGVQEVAGKFSATRVAARGSGFTSFGQQGGSVGALAFRITATAMAGEPWPSTLPGTN